MILISIQDNYIDTNKVKLIHIFDFVKYVPIRIVLESSDKKPSKL